MTILIVDDHQDFRRLVRALVQTAQTDVLECEDGQEAVMAYPQVQPDIVLMDISMKKLDGLSATRQILSRFPKAKILILTQYDDPDLRRAAREAGACGYLLKEDVHLLQTHLPAHLPPQP